MESHEKAYRTIHKNLVLLILFHFSHIFINFNYHYALGMIVENHIFCLVELEYVSFRYIEQSFIAVSKLLSKFKGQV